VTDITLLKKITQSAIATVPYGILEGLKSVLAGKTTEHIFSEEK